MCRLQEQTHPSQDFKTHLHFNLLAAFWAEVERNKSNLLALHRLFFCVFRLFLFFWRFQRLFFRRFFTVLAFAHDVLLMITANMATGVGMQFQISDLSDIFLPLDLQRELNSG